MKKVIPCIIVLSLIFISSKSFSQVGINTTNPLSTLDINGNVSVKTFIMIGSATPTTISDGFYLSLNPQATNQEFILPSPISFPGRMYILRNISDTNTAKLTTPAGLLFGKGKTTGGATSIYMYDDNNRTITVISDGLNWTYIY
ncbi:MAG: hypothetical protein IPN80_05770 [Flavobacterium sp.]|nr:hypothetical protein [Flavobacterium sp.]